MRAGAPTRKGNICGQGESAREVRSIQRPLEPEDCRRAQRLVRQAGQVQGRVCLASSCERGRTVSRCARHDYELARFETQLMTTKLDHQAAAHNEKQFVLVRMMMPDKLAPELGQLDVRVVELADNLRVPEVVE